MDVWCISVFCENTGDLQSKIAIHELLMRIFMGIWFLETMRIELFSIWWKLPGWNDETCCSFKCSWDSMKQEKNGCEWRCWGSYCQASCELYTDRRSGRVRTECAGPKNVGQQMCKYTFALSIIQIIKYNSWSQSLKPMMQSWLSMPKQWCFQHLL